MRRDSTVVRVLFPATTGALLTPPDASATPARRVHLGWSDISRLMPIGSRWQVVIPPALVYGDGGTGDTIGPAAPSLFEIQLVAIAGDQERRSAPPD
jgi:hypothetical protein